MLDLDRLHYCIEHYIQEDKHIGSAPRCIGMTTSFLYLMLAEVQLCDALNRHFVYITVNEASATRVCRQFVKLLREEADVHIAHEYNNEIRVAETNTVFFFMGMERFLHRYVLMGTKLDRIFVDISTYGTYKQRTQLADKLMVLRSVGAEII